MIAKVVQLCPTLCDPMDYTVHGILQARILEWVAFSFSRGSSQTKNQTQVSHITGGFFYQLSHKGSISHEDFPTSVSLSEESAMANSSENAHWIQIYWINKNVKVLGK